MKNKSSNLGVFVVCYTVLLYLIVVIFWEYRKEIAPLVGLSSLVMFYLAYDVWRKGA